MQNRPLVTGQGDCVNLDSCCITVLPVFLGQFKRYNIYIRKAWFHDCLSKLCQMVLFFPPPFSLSFGELHNCAFLIFFPTSHHKLRQGNGIVCQLSPSYQKKSFASLQKMRKVYLPQSKEQNWLGKNSLCLCHMFFTSWEVPRVSRTNLT